MSAYRLLSVDSDAKTVKGERYGYLTGILYLAPATESGVMDVCTSRTRECEQACLFTAGRAGLFPAIRLARIRKTRMLFFDRAGFLEDLARDISRLIRAAVRRNLIPCVRVNGTSDLPWLAIAMASRFPNVQFYDYTKHVRPWRRVRANYHLTLSYSGHNLTESLEALKHGVNVAVVFSTRRGQPLPETWQGYRVIDGDLSDLRFKDSRGVVVGLRAKGKARGTASPFVILAA